MLFYVVYVLFNSAFNVYIYICICSFFVYDVNMISLHDVDIKYLYIAHLF